MIYFVQKGNKTEYQLSDSGMECLENLLRERRIGSFESNSKDKCPYGCYPQLPERIVILKNPIALLKIDETSLIERAIQLLLANQIEKIVVVVGYAKEKLAAVLSKYKEVVMVENPRYKWTGTMASLACAKDEVKGALFC